MIAAQRRAHRLVWMVAAPFLAVLTILLLLARPAAPAAPPTRSSPETGAAG